ncbi:hypothetical protein LA303_13315 [Candidatus Sulfidibacterium hydrothermale]|uniref:hypothetical protein n=1 Tax=Candidatus Sulfidibacterium hydrothermale TaxID=2875962 RepID=UPI001F0AC95B|nr:hypothetical protein [Candidatus Sulfidibacterium hydrothermale]UBM62359.1 hypothetical protein LA303_13315 [Candidatus Sulfidibacterium hydrothermale]
MKKQWTKLPVLLVVILMAGITLGGLSSCKSKKKLAKEQAAAAYNAKVQQAKKDLTAMLNGTTNWTLDEQFDRLKTIKSYNIDDPEVKDLIVKVENKLTEAKAEAKRKAEEERLRKAEEAKKKAQQAKFNMLNEKFAAIAAAPSYEAANKLIQEALQAFASPDVPVLIIIDQVDGVNDYDRPTTALRFLNYLKDQKTYHFAVDSAKRNDAGKITELELIKK